MSIFPIGVHRLQTIPWGRTIVRSNHTFDGIWVVRLILAWAQVPIQIDALARVSSRVYWVFWAKMDFARGSTKSPSVHHLAPKVFVINAKTQWYMVA
ncbi:hypothetical protein Q1695_000264 [Nippostrongylus brasiliensis]|nr:hypothetical protein Q1695_000264 [Nippostrongylus brasiliensis]